MDEVIEEEEKKDPENCDTCRYSRGAECHYDPPVIVPGPRGGIDSYWPSVSPVDWCGSWQGRRARGLIRRSLASRRSQATGVN